MKCRDTRGFTGGKRNTVRRQTTSQQNEEHKPDQTSLHKRGTQRTLAPHDGQGLSVSF